IAARIESFVDEVEDNRLQSASFQRVSDDDAEVENFSSSAYSAETEVADDQPRERAASKKSRVGKLLSSLGAKKKAPSKKSTSKRAAKEAVSENGEIPDDAPQENSYADAEASVDEPGSRAELATRRGGRRRRRPSKASAPTDGEAAGSDSGAEEATEDSDEPETEFVAEEVAPAEEAAEAADESPAPAASGAPPSRDGLPPRGP